MQCSRRLIERAFHWPDATHVLSPATEHLGPAERCERWARRRVTHTLTHTRAHSARRFADQLEALQSVPDLVILTVELDGTTAGERAPDD